MNKWGKNQALIISFFSFITLSINFENYYNNKDKLLCKILNLIDDIRSLFLIHKNSLELQ